MAFKVSKMHPRKQELIYFGILPTLFPCAKFLAGIVSHELASLDRLSVGLLLSKSEKLLLPVNLVLPSLPNIEAVLSLSEIVLYLHLPTTDCLLST